MEGHGVQERDAGSFHALLMDLIIGSYFSTRFVTEGHNFFPPTR